MKEKKSILVEALVRMSLAYADMTTDDAVMKFNELLVRIKEWVDIDANGKYAILVIERESRAGRYGNVLNVISKLLNKEVKDDGIKPFSKVDLHNKRSEFLELVGFSGLAEYVRKARALDCPKSFLPF